jgi:two-component system cell cycle sensor histidine kinase/response regulator CckA
MILIRRLLLRDLLILAGGVTALILGASWWEQQQALRQQADARAADSLQHLDRTLRAGLERVQTTGNVIQTWWKAGVLDPADPAGAARLVTPLLSGQNAITSLNLARTDERSLLFLNLGGVWSVRELRPAGASAQVRWRRLDSSGRVLDTEPWTPMAYDPRTRPWYLAGAGGNGKVWTEAYAFYTTHDPGITFSIPVRGPGPELRGVAALDFLLDDLTQDVWDAQPTANSRCLVVDAQDRALILPKDPAFESDGARRQAFLQPLSATFLGLPYRLLSVAPQGGIAHFSFEGSPLIGRVQTFEGLPGIHWRLALAIPEEDLMGPVRRRALGLLSLAAATLALAAWRIRRLAARVAAPVRHLSVAAESLGQGELPPPIESDIREIQSLDRALRRAQESLAEQARLQRQLEHSQRMETVGTLAGGIAHDVNNQLAAILGQLHLCRELLPEGHSVLARLQRAEEATRRCAQTTKALLSFSHQSRPELKRLDLNALVSETAAILDRLLGGRIRIGLSLAANLPWVRGDAVQLEQVLMNLAVNARDAMPEGGALDLQTRCDDTGQVCLEVQDSGTGIPPSALSHIFEPFFTTKELGKGTGLGLAMTFGIVKAHQGRIQAENPPGGGALFRIALPPAGGPDDSGSARKLGLRAETRLVGVRVLVVEDEPLLRDMLADALTLARAQVTAAQDGEVAWRAWEAGTFDLVLSDHRMPDCTGYELLQRIRAAGSDMPFILVSGQGLEAMEKELARDPKVSLLPKPFEMPRLLALMAEMLGRKR